MPGAGAGSGGGHAYAELGDDDHGKGGGTSGGGGGGERDSSALEADDDRANAAAAAAANGGGTKAPDDDDQDEAALVTRALEKTTARLMPVVLAIVGLNYLDRTALSFAGVSLSRDLSLSASDFGFASGCFFLGYSLFQLPSNIVAMRLGPRRWLPVLMVVWGIAASSFAALKTPSQLAGLRFLLGAAEAGAFPAIWYALSLYYPRPCLTRPYATMLVAVAVSQVLAAPLAAAMLSLDGLFGLRGWQIVFLAEGLPAILLGLALPWLIPDGPGDARFLTPAERDALRAAVDRAANAGDALMTAPSSSSVGKDALPTRAAAPSPSSSPPVPAPPPSTLALVLATARVWEVWVLTLANILKDMAAFAALFFCPLIVASLLGERGGSGGGGGASGGGGGGGASGDALAPPLASSPSPAPPSLHPPASGTGVLPVLLTAIPFGFAAAGTYAWSGRAQAEGDPAWHGAVPFLVGGALFALFPLARGGAVLSMAALTAGLMGAFCGGPLIVVLVTAAAPKEATAIALPLFNSVGMLGGFAGPVLLGWIVDRTGGSYGTGAAVMGCSLCGAGGVLWLLRAYKLRQQRKREMAAAAAMGAAAVVGAPEEDGSGEGAAVEFTPLKQHHQHWRTGGSGGGG